MPVQFRVYRMGAIALAIVLLLSACQPFSPPAAPTPAASSAPAVTPIPGPDIRKLALLYTDDEHGWIASQLQKNGDKLGGATEMLGRWRQTEDYTADGPFLILSGGDMWTGPAISSWFNGDSAVEVMNLMGYAAAAVGNHEFDFGVETLRRHSRESKFPFLAANLVRKGTTETPDFVKPFDVVTAGGVRVGIIGLSNTLTPQLTNPKNLADFEFLPYADTLVRVMPQVRAAGVDLVVVLTHVCGTAARGLASKAKELGADVLTTGHCHEQIAEVVGGISLIGGGQYWQTYARLTLEVDVTAHKVVGRKAALVQNVTPARGGPAPDPAVAERVTHCQGQTDQALGEVIGYTKNGLAQRAPALLNLVTDAWLWAYGTADVAVTNLGGFRQGINAGPITLDDVVNVLPFNNTLVEVTATGSQLKANLDCCEGAIAGIRYRGRVLTLADGAPIDPQKTYRVLINDFMAGGGDSYTFAQQDSQTYFTAIDWRQPVIDYIKHLGTSAADPLENRLDSAARMP